MHTQKISANAVVDRPGDSVEEDFEPEVIPESDVTSLQFASGFWTPGNGLGMTMLILGMYLNCVLSDAWRKVRSSLDLDDLWIIAQVHLVTDQMDVSNLVQMERIFDEACVDWGIDPVRVAKLVPMVRSWDLTTRWAVLRAVSNSLEAATKRAPNRHVLPHRLVREELGKLLATASK